MGLPTIRVNYMVPFPSRVRGVGAITVTKANGVWSIQEDFTRLSQITPPAANYPYSLFVVYDTVARLYQTVSLQDIQNVVAVSPVGVNIGVANSPYIPAANTSLIYVDTSGGPVVINLTASAARNGLPLSVKDVTGNAGANAITINRSGAELIDGLTAYPINSDYGGVRLNPRTLSYTVAP